MARDAENGDDRVVPRSADRTVVSVVREFVAGRHTGQFDKAGQPYIGHVERVAAEALRLADRFDVDPVSVELAALLHDTIEDTATTIEEIRALGVSDEVIDAVRALTKQPSEPYVDAVTRAARNRVARVVKLADNADNSNEERLALLDASSAARLRRKYALARSILVDGAR